MKLLISQAYPFICIPLKGTSPALPGKNKSLYEWLSRWVERDRLLWEKRASEKMAGNKRGVVDWTQAPDPTMRHNRTPTMVLHMKEGREWRPLEIGARSVILYLTRVPRGTPLPLLFLSSSSFSRFIAVFPCLRRTLTSSTIPLAGWTIVGISLKLWTMIGDS